MPDSPKPDQPKQPVPPAQPTPSAPVPSPPLPADFQAPGAGKPRGSNPSAPIPSPPVPSPPLPPIGRQAATPAAKPAEPTEFKFDGGAPAPTAAPQGAAATPSQNTPAQTAPQAKTTAAPPAGATPPAGQAHPGQAQQGQARPAGNAGPNTGSPKPSGPKSPRPQHTVGSPPAPGTTPAVPRPAHLQSLHVEEEEADPARISGNVLELWLARAEPIAQWMFRVGTGVSVACLAFLMYAIFAGKIGQPGVPPALIGYLKMAGTGLHFGLLLLSLSLIVLAFDSTAVSIGILVVGVLLSFGAPWAFFNHVGTTAATLAVVTGLRATGTLLTTVGAMKLALDVGQWIMHLPERMKARADIGVGRKAEAAQQRVARDANVMSPCWKLPFCRETIRKQCPAFLAKQTCWKFGRGCYCDEEMISRIIRGESLDMIKAPTRLSKTGKAPCRRCHIYLEHQGHKFRALSPLTLPATAVIMYAIWPIWEKMFSAFNNSPIWTMLSFNPKKLAPEAIASNEVASGGLPPEQVIHFATILFGVLLGFFVLIYVAKFIEWFVYKAKL